MIHSTSAIKYSTTQSPTLQNNRRHKFNSIPPHNTQLFKVIGDMNSSGDSKSRRKVCIDDECVNWRKNIYCGIRCGVGVEGEGCRFQGIRSNGMPHLGREKLRQYKKGSEPWLRPTRQLRDRHPEWHHVLQSLNIRWATVPLKLNLGRHQSCQKSKTILTSHMQSSYIIIWGISCLKSWRRSYIHEIPEALIFTTLISREEMS